MVSLVNTFGKRKEIMFLEKKSFINMLKLYLKINNIQKNISATHQTLLLSKKKIREW